jgi:hypothetical protein
MPEALPFKAKKHSIRFLEKGAAENENKSLIAG